MLRSNQLSYIARCLLRDEIVVTVPYIVKDLHNFSQFLGYHQGETAIIRTMRLYLQTIL